MWRAPNIVVEKTFGEKWRGALPKIQIINKPVFQTFRHDLGAPINALGKLPRRPELSVKQPVVPFCAQKVMTCKSL